MPGSPAPNGSCRRGREAGRQESSEDGELTESGLSGDDVLSGDNALSGDESLSGDSGGDELGAVESVVSLEAAGSGVSMLSVDGRVTALIGDVALTTEDRDAVLTGESKLGREVLLVVDDSCVIAPFSSRSIDDVSGPLPFATAAFNPKAPAATAAVAPAAVTVCQREKDGIGSSLIGLGGDRSGWRTDPPPSIHNGARPT